MQKKQDDQQYIFRMSFTARDGRKIYSKNGKPFKIPIGTKGR